MKIAAFVSSSSHHGNTATAVQKFLEGARAAGAETERKQAEERAQTKERVAKESARPTGKEETRQTQQIKIKRQSRAGQTGYGGLRKLRRDVQVHLSAEKPRPKAAAGRNLCIIQR